MGKTDVNVMTGTKVPALRFKGFNDEWVEKKLGDVLTSYPSRKHISDFNCDDDTMYLEIQQGDSPKAGYSKGVPFEEFSEVILFGDHTLSLYSPDEPFVLSTDGLKILGSNSLDIDFLYEIININKPVSEGYKRHFSILRSRRVKYPISPNEQLQIGQTFKTADALIQSEEQKLEQLQSLKKSFLQKMFPKKRATVPELRFDGFSGDWTEKKLGDVLSYEQPTKYIVDSDNYDESYDIPVLTAGKSFLLGYTNETEGLYDKGEVILFDDFTTATQLVDFEFKVKSSAMKLLTPIDDNNINFLYESLNMIQYPHDDHKRYWISEFATLKVMLPRVFEEQQAIGQFFKTFDELIAKQEEKVENGKLLKKALLQKMFV